MTSVELSLSKGGGRGRGDVLRRIVTLQHLLKKGVKSVSSTHPSPNESGATNATLAQKCPKNSRF